MTKGWKIPYSVVGSRVGPEELAAVGEVLKSGATLSGGDHRTAFERAFRDLVGSRHALTVTSGTVALELATSVLDLRPGDQVIATPQTYQATIQPLLGRGLSVRFCDIDASSLNVDPRSVEEQITTRTRAIFVVHYGGWPADMEALMALARTHGLAVVEDCAHALGSKLGGRTPGSLADIGCFSFHSSKNITTLGEGGMITFDRDDWADRVGRMRSNEPDATFDEDDELRAFFTPTPGAVLEKNALSARCEALRRPGTNATMSEAAAAVGLVQLAKLDALVARRREVADAYRRAIEGIEGVRASCPVGDIRHAYHLFTLFVDPATGIDRNRLVSYLREVGIEVQLRYFPLHLLPEWRAQGHGPGECPVTEKVWFEQQVNLPCHPSLTHADVAYVCEQLVAGIAASRRRSDSRGSGPATAPA
jgi:perosamine synthetase